MKLAYTSLLMLSLALVVSCGEKLDPVDKGSEGRKASVEKKAKAARMAPAGNSSLVPDGPGFSAFDQAKLAATRNRDISLCGIDRTFAVKGQPTNEFKTSDTINIVGWVLNPKRQAPERFGLLLVGDTGTYAIPGRAGKIRPDVSKRYKSKAAARAGFTVSGELASVAPGEYGFSLLQDSGDIVTVCSSSKRRIKISR